MRGLSFAPHVILSSRAAPSPPWGQPYRRPPHKRRLPMNRSTALSKVFPAAGMTAALALLCTAPASASTAYGTLNNFDVFNDTGVSCHGFEIEIEDARS